jgi:GMP synthase (glutamine-hydrolysing)
MKKSLAFIDCFMETPVNHCVNDYIIHSGLPCTYHMVSRFGADSLKSLKQADGYVILGSASHVTEKLDWHQQLLDFIIPKLENGIPVLGICFGHQLLAHHYGCKVGYLHEDKFKHTETRSIKITNDQMGLSRGQQLTLAYSHSQVVQSLTKDIHSFANSPLSPNEAIYHSKYPMWCFQAHPEASEKFIIEDAKTTDPATIKQVIQDGHGLIDSFTNSI